MLDNPTAMTLMASVAEYVSAPSRKYNTLAVDVFSIMDGTTEVAAGIRRATAHANGEDCEQWRTSVLSTTLFMALQEENILSMHKVPIGASYVCDVAISAFAAPRRIQAMVESRDSACATYECAASVAHLLQLQGTSAVFLLLFEGTAFSVHLLQRSVDRQIRRTWLCAVKDRNRHSEALLAAWLRVMEEFVGDPPDQPLLAGKSMFVQPHKPSYRSYRLRGVVAQGDVMYRTYDQSQLAALAFKAARRVEMDLRAADSAPQAPAPPPASPTTAAGDHPPRFAFGRASSAPSNSAAPPAPGPLAEMAIVEVAEEPTCATEVLLASRSAVLAARHAMFVRFAGLGGSKKRQHSATNLREQTAAAAVDASVSAVQAVSLTGTEVSTIAAAAVAAARTEACAALDSAVRVAKLRQGVVDNLSVRDALALRVNQLDGKYLDAVYAAEAAVPCCRMNLALMEEYCPKPVTICVESDLTTVVRFPSVCARHPHLPKSPAQLLKFVALVESVHAKGFVLGDLRPANVLFGGDDESVFLIDFDLAREVAESPTYPYCYRTMDLEIARHPAAKPGAWMSKEHDLFAVVQCLKYYAAQEPCVCSSDARALAGRVEAGEFDATNMAP